MAKNKGKKKPKVETYPIDKKQPRVAENLYDKKQPIIKEDANSWYDRYPSWRFNRIDAEHYKWSPISNGILNSDNLEKLKNYEKKTWSEILIRDNNRNHLVETCNFIKEARDRLEELHIHDEQLISLGLCSTYRVYGVAENGVMSIIWFDLEHEIYPVPKKHT